MKTKTSDASLLVGLDAPDDAAVYLVAPDLAIVQTVDYFTPIVDDPYWWGRIAAANSLSDLYAMGARPVTALNLVGWPRSLDFALLGRVLVGAGETCEAAGAAVVGGHSVDDPEPKFGLSVTGLAHPEKIVRKIGGRPGDVLVLTKPLGTGIVSSAVKEQVADAEWVDAAVHSMAALNDGAAAAMVGAGVSAATDVTGFGLAGHLLGMLGDRLDARLRFAAVPMLPGALELSERGVYPGGSKRNEDSMRDRVSFSGLQPHEERLFFDAQTSGGLLMAVPAAALDALIEGLQGRGVTGHVIGALSEGSGSVEVSRS